MINDKIDEILLEQCTDYVIDKLRDSGIRPTNLVKEYPWWNSDYCKCIVHMTGTAVSTDQFKLIVNDIISKLPKVIQCYSVNKSPVVEQYINIQDGFCVRCIKAYDEISKNPKVSVCIFYEDLT